MCADILTDAKRGGKQPRVIISQRMKADLIIANIGQLVTCASKNGPKRGDEMLDVGIIEKAAIVVAEGRIVALGTSDQITSEFLASDFVDAEGKVISPGFVDPHTHIVFAGNRLDEFELKIKGADYLKLLGKGGGILSTVRATREASFDELVTLGLTRLDKMLACGTTTCEIKTGYGLDTESELKMLCVVEELDRTHPIDIVPTFLAAHTIPSEFNGNADGYVTLICNEMLPTAWDWYVNSEFSTKGTPFFCDVFAERNAFDVHQMKTILSEAKDIGFGTKAHVDQFTNLGGSHLAMKAGAVSIDHLDTISDDEIKELASSETLGVAIPTENFNAGKMQFAPARRMIDAGCAVAISTDYNPGSAPCPSQPMAMAITCRYQKLLPSEALNAATINAAYAIGLGNDYGSIEVGKHADFTLFNCEDYRYLAYEFGGNFVKAVYKNGRMIHGKDR